MKKPRPAGPAPSSPVPRADRRWRPWGAVVLLVVAAWIYAPALRGGWLWDDNSEITNNPELRDPAGWWHIWVAPRSPDYFPLKSSVQWVEWRLWRDHTTVGYHATSWALHLLSIFLFWHLLRRLGVRFAWLGALVFLVHPLAVESVAWIAELKNTLSLPLLLLAMLAYINYDESRRARDRWICTTWFLAAMLAKSSVVMFPAVALLYTWWKRGRVTRDDVVRTLPLWAVAVALGAITVVFQHQRAIAGLASGDASLGMRVMRASWALVFYLAQAAWPSGAGPVRPAWSVASVPAAIVIPGLVGAALGYIVWRWRGTWGRAIGFGLGCFFLNLLPVLGVIPMSYLRVSWVSEHFVYISLLGFAGLVAAGVGAWAARLTTRGRALLYTGVGVGMAVLAAESRNYAATFANPVSFWSHALVVNPTSALAHDNLGVARLGLADAPGAMREFQAAVDLDAADALAQLHLAEALDRSGSLAEALDHFARARQLDPDSADVYYNEGNALAAAGRLDAAVADYREALRRAPGMPDAEYNLANALVQKGDSSGAIEHYILAVRAAPDFGPAQLNLGNTLAEGGDIAGALPHFQAAARLMPRSFEALFALADALAVTGHGAEAVPVYESALQLEPENFDARRQFAAVLETLGRNREAQTQREFAAGMRARATPAPRN